MRHAAALIVVVVVAIVVVPSRTRADLGEVSLLGDQANLMGGAVAATIRGGTAIWYNPAGLALPTFDRPSVAVSGVGYALRWLQAPGLVQGAGTPPTDVGAQNVAVIPRVTTVTFAPKRPVRLGIGIFSPVRQDVNFQLDPTYQFETGTASNSLIQKTMRTCTHIVLAFAYSISDKLQIGGTVHIVAYRYFDMVSLASVYDDATVASLDRSFTNGTQSNNFGTGLAFTFGVAYAPTSWLKLGASVTSPSMMIFEREQFQSTLTATANGGVTEVRDQSRTRGFTFEIPEPAIIRFGAAYTHPKLTVEVDGDIVTPAQSVVLRVDRGFSGNARVGTLIELMPKLRLGLGFFTARGGASQVANTLGATAVNGLGATAGVTLFSQPPGEVRQASHKVLFAITAALRYTHYKGDILGAAIQRPGDPASLSLTPTPVAANEIALHLGIDAVF